MSWGCAGGVGLGGHRAGILKEAGCGFSRAGLPSSAWNWMLALLQCQPETPLAGAGGCAAGNVRAERELGLSWDL